MKYKNMKQLQQQLNFVLLPHAFARQQYWMKEPHDVGQTSQVQYLFSEVKNNHANKIFLPHWLLERLF